MTTQTTILIIDDTPENLALIAGLLKPLYRTRVAPSGAKGLELAVREPRPDLILLDILMSEMDGYEVCRRLKADPATAAIPVVFLTALTEEENEQSGLEAGAVDFITKPVKPAILLARVATQLNLKNARDEIAVARDQAQAALAKLQATQEQLVQAEKLAALAGLVAGIAHEINTPVGIALTAASTLEDETAKLRALVDTGQAKKSHVGAFLDMSAESARLITGHCRHAGELIRSFKMMAVDQTCDERRSLDLGQYLGDVVRSLGPELKKTRAVLAVECPEGLMVETYPGALSQIVTNLVMNSVIHGLDEGRQEGRITLTASRTPSGIVELRHADSGKGVPAELAGRIFEPFFTTRRGRGGSGLGLGIVHNLVTRSLAGAIHLEGTPGGGATFVIRFPANPIPAAEGTR